jgi:hypothetical protein
LSEGDFITLTDGFRAGQKVRINSTSRNVDEYFVINQVTLAQFGHETFVYKISLITTKTFDLIDLLSKLVTSSTKQIVINPDEIIDLVESLNENISISDSITLSKVHNPQTEAISMSETFTAQSLNYDVKFVAGPQAPSTTKRVFVLDGSPLR